MKIYSITLSARGSVLLSSALGAFVTENTFFLGQLAFAVRAIEAFRA